MGIRVHVGRFLLASLCLALVPVSLARAHAHPAVRVEIDANDVRRIAVQVLNAGLLVTNDAGERWAIACDALIGQPPDAPAVTRFLPDGGLLVASQNGLHAGTEDACSFQPAALAPASTGFDDLVIGRDGTRYAAVFADDLGGRILVQRDAEAFTALLGLGVDLRANALRLSEGQSATLYASVTSAQTPEGPAQLVRSTDDGTTWETLDARSGLRLLQADTGGRLWAVAPAAADNAVVLRSDDAGASFSEVLQVRELGGFVADGERVWIGDAWGGLHHSTDAGGNFEEVATLGVTCMTFGHDQLWLCADNFVDGFALARVDTDTHAITPLLRLQQARALVECADQTTVAELCAQAMIDWKADVLDVFDPPDKTPSPSDAGTDAGKDPAPKARSSSCSASPSARGNVPIGAWLPVLALFRARRDRRDARLRRPGGDPGAS